jgi:hypothetical protein
MRHAAAHFIHLGLNSLSRRPAMTVMMVYSVGIGVAAMMAVFAVWRIPSKCPTSQSVDRRYLVEIPAGIASRSGLLDMSVNGKNVFVAFNGRPGVLAVVT